MDEKKQTDFKRLLRSIASKEEIGEAERKDFRTKQRKVREAVELEIYNKYVELTALPGASKMEVMNYLCRQYGIATVQTIYSIKKRVEKRISEGKA